MPTIWFLSDGKTDTSALRARVRQVCEEQDPQWRHAFRSARPVRDVEGRPLQLISCRDLRELFNNVHRDDVALIDTCDTRALLDPRDEENDRISSSRTMRLERLMVYRTIWQSLPASSVGEQIDQVATELASLVAAGGKMEDTDPMSVPFLPFDLGRKRNEDLRLFTDEGKREFHDTFGPPRSREDADEVMWKLDPRAYHGSDTLKTRGRVLPQGMHWDVEVKRGAKYIRMANEVWHVKKGQYINVYPDLAVRTTRKNGGKRHWPKTS